ncbi:MAG: phospholipase [Flavobacteriales bacterium]|nr:MAG: phospholipase [Flavobacteriales bacterium]
MKTKITLAIAMLLFSCQLFAQDQYKKELYIVDGDTLPYRILFPENFSETEKYPLMVFLHGAGERGKDNQKQLQHGSKFFLDSIQKYPAVVIFPQCPTESFWANADVDSSTRPYTLNFPGDRGPTKPLELTMSLLDVMVQKNYIDNTKVYLGGLSMGGMGTFELLSRKPNFFAAAFAICGGGNAENAKNYAKTTPIWIFHGSKDNIVNPQWSIDIVSSLLKNGGLPKFTLYSQADHNSWDNAFAEATLLKWLFSHTKDN